MPGPVPSLSLYAQLFGCVAAGSIAHGKVNFTLAPSTRPSCKHAMAHGSEHRHGGKGGPRFTLCRNPTVKMRAARKEHFIWELSLE